MGAASTLSDNNEHRGKPGFPAMCWRYENNAKSVKSDEISDDHQSLITENQIENCVENKMSINKIQNSLRNASDPEIFKILPNDTGSVFSILASLNGAKY